MSWGTEKFMNSRRKCFALRICAAGNDLILEDLLLVVEVVQEEVQRRDPLDEAGLKARPFAGRDDSRDQVEREDPLGALRVIVDGEGHAAPQEGEVDRCAPPFKLGERKGAQPLDETAIMGTNGAACCVHLVEKIAGVIGVA